MDIIKRKGLKEIFDERKLYASLYAALLSVRSTDEEAENLASTVVKEIKQQYEGQAEVSSTALRKAASAILHRYQPEAALIYESHLDIS